jgi:hypothetical protein
MLSPAKQPFNIGTPSISSWIWYGWRPLLVFYPVKGEDFWESWMIFQRFSDKEWSFVDCAILHMAQRLGVSEVFSFDRHFDQMSGLGIRRIPLRLR